MSSGNFSVGEDLSLEGFREYVQPNLEKYKTQVTDVMEYSKKGSKRVLVSLIGDANPSALEQTLKISLDEAKPVSQKYFEECNKNQHLERLTAWPHHLGNFKTIGIYQDNETASKVFQNLAIIYSAKNIEHILDDVTSKIKYFGEKFKHF